MVKLNNEIPTRVYFWNKERGLIKVPVVNVEISFLLEEVSEYYRATTEKEKVDALADLVVFSLGWLAKSSNTKHTFTTTYATQFKPVELLGLIYDIAETEYILGQDSIEEQLVGFVDYCLTGMEHLCYDCNIVMEEVLLHIESRVGSVGESGKWEKDKSVIPYTPNYDRAKRG